MKRKYFLAIIWFILALPFILAYLLLDHSKNLYLIHNKNTMTKLIIKSPDFKNNWFIPAKFTCDGQDLFPTLEVENIPESAKSLAIMVEDPDAPMVRPFIHLLAVNVPVANTIDENILSKSTLGVNDFMKLWWNGPCPPVGHWVHHYHFKVYALWNSADLQTGFNLADFVKFMNNQAEILSEWEIVWLYQR